MEQGSDFLRPLLRPTLPKQAPFIDFPYCMTVKELQILKNHLPKTYTLAGVDFESQKSILHSESKQLKGFKTIACQGVERQTKKKLPFIECSALVTIYWSVNISISIPYNNKTPPEKRNNEVNQYLQKLASNYIHLLDRSGRIAKNQSLALEQVSKMKLIVGSPCINLPNSTHTLDIRTELPIVLCLYKEVQSNELLEQIKKDIINSLTIIIKNSLATRVIQQQNQKMYPLNLQTYLADPAGASKNQFSRLFTNIYQESDVDRKPNAELVLPKTSNGFLYMTLAVLIAIYLVFKATDFKRTFGQ